MSVCQIQMLLPCWSSTDRHQIAGHTITQKLFSQMCRCITATTNRGFCGNYVKVHQAVILKYKMHTHYSGFHSNYVNECALPAQVTRFVQ